VGTTKEANQKKKLELTADESFEIDQNNV
jgi:hypothetical protein